MLSPSSSEKLRISVTFISYFGNGEGSCGFGSESAAERIDEILDYGQALWHGFDEWQPDVFYTRYITVDECEHQHNYHLS